MDTGKNIWIQKSSRVIKGLIVSYLVSGAGLLLLALLLLKYQLDERKVSAGILAVYILSGLSGGIYMGKTAERKRYLWGMILGSIYWGILMLLTIFSGAGTGSGVKGAFLTLLICAGSSTLGAMVTGARKQWQIVKIAGSCEKNSLKMKEHML